MSKSDELTRKIDTGGADYALGDIVGEKYKVLSVLGRGGMGVVYKVEQIFLGHELALKTIDKHHLSEATIRRFQHEARATFAVDHPSIIAVRDFGLIDDQTPFLVMELLKGETLAALLKRKIRLSLADAVPIFVKVCFGLAHAHEMGVVHRDIKPSNIIIIDDGRSADECNVKILDFGIAKFTQREGGEVQALTKTGEVFGSPLYMSPEQCSGGKLDQRADVYSLGCVLFEALTGTTPFVGETALATMLMHQSETIPNLKEASLGEEFSPAIEQVVRRMLAKDPEERYQDLGIAAHDLTRALSGGNISFSKTVLPVKTEPDYSVQMSRESLALMIVCVSLVSMFLGGMAMYFWQTGKSAPRLLSGNQSPAEQGQTFEEKEKRQRDEQRADALKDEKGAELVAGRATETSSDFKIHRPEALATHEFRSRYRLIPTDIFTEIAKIPGLKTIDFKFGNFINTDLYKLSGSSVKKVALDMTNLNDVGAAALAKWHDLKEVQISFTGVTDPGVIKLSTLKDLTSLDLEGLKITDKSLLALKDSRTLRDLQVNHCTRITDKGISALNSDVLKNLGLSGTGCTDASLPRLAKLKHLEKLQLSMTAVSAPALRDFCKQSDVAEIFVFNCPHISSGDIKQLTATFPSKKFLATDLRKN